jgi:hypothetical protein
MIIFIICVGPKQEHKSRALRNLKIPKGYINIPCAKEGTKQIIFQIISKPAAHNLCNCNILVLLQTISSTLYNYGHG